MRGNANKREAAIEMKWLLNTSDAWAGKYFDDNDLHSKDRELFAF